MLHLVGAGLSLVGSIFASRDEKTGKIVINVAPLLLLAYVINVGVCAVVETELPFHECVEDTTSSLKELFGL